MQVISNQLTGQLELQTNHYTELANNLNYLNALGGWEPGVDEIQILTNSGGAAALKGSTRAYFPATIGGQGDGPITLVSRSNTVLKIRPFALYYFDAQSGKSALLASPRQAQGELVGRNQVVYRSVFDGLSCDLRLTYTKGAFESDLVMLARPKAPEVYGLNSAYTRMELWHWVDGPAPVQTPTVVASVTDPAIRATMAEPDLIDATLDFSDLHFPQGRAFSWNGMKDESSPDLPVQVHLPNPGANAGEVVVAKRWERVGQMSALVESVQWTNLAPSLKELPLLAGGPEPSTRIQPASLKRQLPTLSEKSASAARPMKMGLAGYKAKGFVWDYVTFSGGYSTFTFTNGTFLINGFATFSGAVTFNAGCRLKYADGSYLFLSGNITCNGTAANPSVLTSMHDNAFGEQITGSTGYPTYSATVAMYLSSIPTAQTLNYMRIRWAQTAISDNVNVGLINTATNCSFEWCQTGLWISNATMNVQSSTQCSVGTPFSGSGTWSVNGTLADVCNGTDPVTGLPLSWEYMNTSAVATWAC